MLVSSRGYPVLTMVNGPLMAWRSWPDSYRSRPVRALCGYHLSVLVLFTVPGLAAMPRALGRSDAGHEPFVVTAGDICWSAGCFRVSGEAGEAPC